MFFKREKEPAYTFSGQMDSLRNAGYSIAPAAGLTRVSKGNLAAMVADNGGKGAIVDVGLLIGNEVAVLTDLGYQKIFLTPTGKKTAALAEHLEALHAFKEDLAEAMGITSLYNEGLGTTNEKHLYDRVEGRDQAATPKPWEKN